MKFVVIAGDSAVGKMTVAQHLCEMTELRLFHNHIMIEPQLDVFGYYDSKVINRLRDVVFEEFAKTELYGIVFTCMIDYDNPSIGLDYIDNIVKLMNSFREEPVEVYYVELDATLQTRLERNVSENRLKYKPSKRDTVSSNIRLIKDSKCGRFISLDAEIPYSNFIRIINDNINPLTQAKLIKNKFNL